MNIGEWTTNWALRYPDEPLIKYGDLELTKGGFNKRVNQAAHAFSRIGVTHGTCVAALLGNSNVFLEILFALSKLGAIMVPLNFRLAVPELEYIINNSEPEVTVYSPEFAPVVDELRGLCPSVKNYICEMDGGSADDPLYDPWISGESEDEPAPGKEPTLEDTHIIMYTSGTTGKPKGAVISQGNTQWNAINCIHMYAFDPGQINVCCAPLFHIGALNVSATPSIYAGSKLVIQRFFDPGGVLQMIEQEKAHTMFGIPVMFLMMSSLPEFEKTDLSTVKFFIAGGSPCPKSLIETFQQKDVGFNQGYGLTETATAVTALRTEDSLRKLGSCGKPVFHTNVRIVDLEDRNVPAGTMGEILVKGPNVIKEYWKRPEESAATIVDGWLHTGDMGYIDDDGYLFIVDRRKDMYISGGENVYPAEVEDVLMSFPKIADAGVIGMPDEKWGEVGLAVIVRQPDTEVTEEEIIEYCKLKLAKYKVPREIRFTEALPRTLTGKILKKDMREMYIK